MRSSAVGPRVAQDWSRGSPHGVMNVRAAYIQSRANVSSTRRSQTGLKAVMVPENLAPPVPENLAPPEKVVAHDGIDGDGPTRGANRGDAASAEASRDTRTPARRALAGRCRRANGRRSQDRATRRVATKRLVARLHAMVAREERVNLGELQRALVSRPPASQRSISGRWRATLTAAALICDAAKIHGSGTSSPVSTASSGRR